MRKRQNGLGSADDIHLAEAKQEINQAWDTLERMPPTCEGGIQMASRAHALAERGIASAHSIEDRATREANTDLFGLGNRALTASWETVRFYAQTCKAPHREAADRPLFSRAKFLAEMRAADKKAARKKRR